jgi:hypothetical protein
LISELADFASHEFKLGIPDKTGKPAREHFEQVEKSTGKRPPELDGPLMPECTELVWEVFCKLHSTRQAGMGVSPISYTEIECYCRLTGIKLYQWQLRAIKTIDDAYLKSQRESTKE